MYMTTLQHVPGVLMRNIIDLSFIVYVLSVF